MWLPRTLRLLSLFELSRTVVLRDGRLAPWLRCAPADWTRLGVSFPSLRALQIVLVSSTLVVPKSELRGKDSLLMSL